jgi:DNA invertase Pin-like site-specific DNA recombinase
LSIAHIDRPELTAVLDYLRAGDTLVVWKLDRLGRSLIDLVSIVDGLRDRGIGFKILTGALSAVDTTSADGRLFFQIIAAMAEFERSLIKDRTKAGLEAAKAQGRTGGRSTVITDDLLTVAKARKAKGESVSAIAKALGVSRATLYRHLSDQEQL